MKTLPSYLSATPVPDRSSIEAQVLRRVQQSVSASLGVLGSVDEAVKAWKGLTAEQRKNAEKETGLDSGAIEGAANDLLSAQPGPAKEPVKK